MKLSKKKIIIISIVSVLVIAGAVFAYLYFCTDMFKSTQELFYEYAGKSAMVEDSYSYQDMLEDIKVAQTKSYTGTATIGLEVNDKTQTSSSSIMSQSQATANILKNLKLKVQTKSKPSEKKAAYNVALEFANNKITDFDIVKTKDLYGIKSNLLDSNYIAVENNNLKDLFAKFGANTAGIPNKIEEIDLYDLLYVSKEDQERLTKIFTDSFKDGIPASNYSKIGNVTKTINGQEKNVNGYSLKLSGKDMENVLTNALTKLKDDDRVLDLFVEKTNKLMDTPAIKSSLDSYQTMANSKLRGSIYSKANTFTIPKLTKETLKQSLDQVLNQYKNSSNNIANEVQVLEIAVYESNGKIAKLEINVAGQTIMAVDYYEENGVNHAVIYMPQTSSTSYYSSIPSYQLVKMMDVTYTVKQNGNEKKANIGIALFTNDKQVAKMSMEITQNGKVGEGKNTSYSIITIETPEVDMKLNIDSEVEYTDNFDVQEINATNSKVLNNMSRSEIEAYFTNIQKNIKNMVPTMPTNTNSTLFSTPFNTNTTIDQEKLTDMINQSKEIINENSDLLNNTNTNFNVNQDELNKMLEESMKNIYGI